MSKPPKSPYAPDPDPEGPPVTELGDLLDVVMEDTDWANTVQLRPSWRRVELRRVRLTGAQLAEATLIDVTFADCRIDLASFRFARLERVAFRDCRLEEAEFGGARLKDVVFERCDLRAADFSAVKGAQVDLLGCRLDGLRGVDALRGARMRWADVVENAALFAAALEIETVD